MRFEFATATRILFGAGTFAEVTPAARAMGRRAVLVTGRHKRHSIDMEHCWVPVPHEPVVDLVRLAAELARNEECDVVVAIGGGSAIDAGKAIAALLTNPGEPLDYLEVVGGGATLKQPSAPFIAVPTTAGTGAEVTRNAVLLSPEHRVKASLRSPFMLPRLAVVDPELTLDLLPALTASTGLDALTQLIEPYVSSRANPMTDALCVDGIRRAARSLERACANGRDLEARTDMALAGLLGGLALANAGLGAVHGLAAPIGGMFDAPHGAVCAALLPGVIEANVRAVADASRYAEVARLLTGRSDAGIEDGIDWVRRVCRALAIPGLGSYGMQQADLPVIAEAASKASSMKANPVALSHEVLCSILGGAL